MAARHEPAPVGAGRLLGGRYRLENLLARGGMAEVWEGHDEVLTRPVAVKILDSARAADGLFLERFRREAVTMARVVHPAVVSTFDTGVDDGTAYIVMELVRGRTLRRLVQDHGRLPAWLAAGIAAQVADALVPAHAAGLVHRDIKPANILLLEGDLPVPRVKITDFGIAKAGASLGGDLTQTGIVLGTPKYLSPEQVKGEEPDSRADLYSLGVVLFEMLAGEPPFRGSSDMETAMAHLQKPVPKLSRTVKDVPPDLEAHVERLLSKNPADRPGSALEVRKSLEDLGLAPPGAGDVPPGPDGRTRRLDPSGPDPRGRSGSKGRPGGAGRRDSKAGPKQKARRRLPGRAPGLVVLCLALAGLGVAAGVLASESGGGPRGGSSNQIRSVSVWMVTDVSKPDDPQGTKYTFDGNPATSWHTDQYDTPDFGGLYPGIGLEIHATGSTSLRQLEVTSQSSGWSAETFVSSSQIASGAPLGDWGRATDSKSGIDGSTTFSLGGRTGQWVLLWLTYLGPARQVYVNELAVT